MAENSPVSESVRMNIFLAASPAPRHEWLAMTLVADSTAAFEEFGDTDVVMACTESDRLLSLNASTYHAAREVDECLVYELHVLYLAVERNLHAGSVRVGGVASG